MFKELWENCFKKGTKKITYKSVNYDHCKYIDFKCINIVKVDVIPISISKHAPFYLLSSEQWDSLHGYIRAMRKLLNSKCIEKFHMKAVCGFCPSFIFLEFKLCCVQIFLYGKIFI